MRHQFLAKTLSCTLAVALALGTVSTGISFRPVMVSAEEASEFQATGTYQFSTTSDWDEGGESEKNLPVTTNFIPKVGATITADVLIPGVAAFQGSIKAAGILRVGADWKWVQSNEYPALTATDFKETVSIGGKDYAKASIAIPFSGLVGANTADGWSNEVAFETAVDDVIAQVSVKLAGYQCDYSGEIAIANAKLQAEEAGADETVVKTWDFNDGIGSWQNAGWDWQYDGTAATVEAGSGMLKVGVDYSKGADNSWSQIGIQEWGNVDLKDVTKTTFDFYYDPAKLTKGTFAIKEVLQADEDGYPSAVEETASVDTESAVDADVEGLSGWKKVPVSITFDPISKNICNVVLCLVSQNTTYSGALYIDNLEMKKAAAAEDIYVDATKETKEQSAVSVADGKLKTFDKSGAEKTTALSDSIKMVDGNADAGTKAIYSYLQAMGASDSVIFGHQDDTWQKAGSSELLSSDTEDVVGSIAGVVGIDTLSMVGNEWSAERYNKEIVAAEELPDTEKLPETAAGNVTAAAKLTNRNIADGAIITLSAHMPNFSIVKENADYDAAKDPSYAKYDFSGYTPNTITNDVMNEILPGGAYNEVYKAFLDMVADYASQVEGTVLFRPFHENTGSWFWWGKAFCNASTYKNVFRYTVEYLRDTKNVHNFIYVYGPGSEAASVEEYGERYPGDAYVDMVGFDMYHRYVKANDTWFTSFKEELKIVDDFAKAHNKLIAVTETGVASDPDKGDNQTALHKTGNEQKDWYNTMLDAVSESSASYFLLWANFSEKDGFYTPYVKSVSESGVLHGHEMLDNFIDFYNDPRSVFAEEQKTALAGLKDTVKTAAAAVQEGAFGYITAPVGGKRILEAVSLTASLSGVKDGTAVSFLCKNEDKTAELTAQISGSTATAVLDAEKLLSLGEGVGSIQLSIDKNVVDEINVIFNIPEPVKDPYEIDSFETYFGEASVLQKEWATNKGTGCTIDLALTDDTDKVYDGSYSLKFSYSENGGGWAGATISKEVDWSDCNALRFWTIPDGQNRRVVIQITAGGKEYEAYLNRYDAYKDKTTPLLVTIPFAEFIDRDGDGPAGGLVELSNQIQSFGLWVNQDDDFDVSGTIYYDKITAVKSDVTTAAFESGTASNVKKAGSITEVKASYKKAAGSKAFTLKAKGTGTVTYKSSNTKVVKVGKKTGKVTVKGIGKAAITITSAANDTYKKATKKVTITVTPKKVASVKAKAQSGNKVKLSWKKLSGVTGYQIQYAAKKNFKGKKTVTVKGAAKKSTVLKKLKKGKTWYIRIRAYKKSGKTTIYGAFNTVKL